MTDESESAVKRDWRRDPAIWIAAVVVLVLIVGSLLRNGVGGGSDDSDSSPTVLGPAQVTYEAEGTARYGSYTAQFDTGTSQGDADLPLQNKQGTRGLTFSMPRGRPLYFSIQNGEETGSVTCRIRIGSRVVSENTSAGAYAIASCSGRS